MYCLRRGNGMPLAWGHTRLLETDWRLITQESHCFSCGSVNVLDVKNAPLDWGFWIKIICHCVYGYHKVNQKFQNLDKVKSQAIHVLA